jgi:hypothetical protein
MVIYGNIVMLSGGNEENAPPLRSQTFRILFTFN